MRRTLRYTNSVQMQNADEPYVTENRELVSRLITQLEGSVATTSDESDMVQTSQYRELRGAISFILPYVLCDIFQICVLFGSKRWRKRRSIHASLVRVIMNRGPICSEVKSKITVSCSCSMYRTDKQCVHVDAVINHEPNRMRIMTFATRRLPELSSMAAENEWNDFKIPIQDGDDVDVWHFFLRRSLSSVSRTSSAVLFDKWKVVNHKHPRLRIQCLLCPGLAPNSTLCLHEMNASRFIPEENDAITNST